VRSPGPRCHATTAMVAGRLVRLRLLGHVARMTLR
jgi:hypothetical protein